MFQHVHYHAREVWGGFGVAGARCAISEFAGRFDVVLWPAYVVTWRGTNKRLEQSEEATELDDVTD